MRLSKKYQDGRDFPIAYDWVHECWAPRPRFLLGRVVITLKAVAILNRSGQDAQFFLEKHASGDWGVIDPQQSAGNEVAVQAGHRIVSLHHTLLGEKLMIRTDGSRTTTTVLTIED
ncbi:MAG: hypothetical protein U1D30_14580 [Planctomycetota bacterium]